MKLLAQQRELQVSLPSISVYYNTLSSTIQKPDPALPEGNPMGSLGFITL
jgi:hypothetical protein